MTFGVPLLSSYSSLMTSGLFAGNVDSLSDACSKGLLNEDYDLDLTALLFLENIFLIDLLKLDGFSFELYDFPLPSKEDSELEILFDN